MKTLYCWRCRTDIPMLDEGEWAVVQEALNAASQRARTYHRAHETPISVSALFDFQMEKMFQPALDAYERITGFRELNHAALYHHRIVLYGEPCEHCGRPLRTPEAKLCASCFVPVSTRST